MSYLLNTPADREAMLASIGVASVEELFDPIPEHIRLRRPLDLPAALSEIGLTRHVNELAAKNLSAANSVCFLGGGAYDHFIPAVVDNVAARSEYYTAYTPYQAEASQGSLQAFYEFQTLVCQLTGLEVSNASLYEGGSAVAEAVMMALGIGNRPKKVLVADSVHPHYRQTLATYAAPLGIELVTLPTPEGFLNPDDLAAALDSKTACVVAQHPNFFGCLEETQAIGELCRKSGALFVVAFDPVSLGVLKKPGDYGADIAVAEGQGLGAPLNYGGPYLGLMACRQEYLRRIPGRLVGETTDRNGKRCWVLTLQTREQHIRREKATSNICTNQGLFALRAAVHLAALGPLGLRETAEHCLRKAHYAAEKLAEVGLPLAFRRPFFKEFVVRAPAGAGPLGPKLRDAGYLAALPVGRWYAGLADCFGFAVTEKRTRAEIDGLAAAVGRALGDRADAPALR